MHLPIMMETSANMGLPTPLCFVQIPLGDFGNPGTVIR